jgi:hypothetical protein
LIVFSQFGGKLAASSAWHWWLVGFFMVVTTIEPNWLRPVADAFGIKFISNMVFAVLVMILFAHSVSAQSQFTFIRRKLRQFVSNDAVDKSKSQVLNTAPRCLIIVPVFNEEHCIEEVFDSIYSAIQNTPGVEVCFINDGSTDRSRTILDQFTSGFVLHHAVNIGVSGVMQTGFVLARRLGAHCVIQFDGDGQHPADRIPQLISTFENAKEKIDCVLGSRFKGASITKRLGDASTSSARAAANLLLTQMINISFGANITDPTSGFRLYSQKAVEFLMQEMPDDFPEPEALALLSRQGFKVQEIAVTMNARTGGVSSLSGFQSIIYMSKVINALIGLKLRQHLPVRR